MVVNNPHLCPFQTMTIKEHMRKQYSYGFLQLNLHCQLL